MKKIILEATYEILNDVEYIFNKSGYADFLEKFNSTEDLDEKRELADSFDGAEIKSSDLPSEEAKRADKINPIVIINNITYRGNYYNTLEKVINISANKNVIDIIVEDEVDSVHPSSLTTFWNELTPTRIKASIYHELTHWLDDTFNNQVIYRQIKKTIDTGKSKYKNLNKKDVNMTHYEVNAQIHAIKMFKKEHEEEWDEWDLKDLFVKYTSLKSIYDKIKSNYGEHELKKWLKDLLSRMNRENLLGEKMKKSVLNFY